MTPEQRDATALAVCRGTVCMFTRREQYLLGLADASGRPDLVDSASRIRKKRSSLLEATCARLRAEGKL